MTKAVPRLHAVTDDAIAALPNLESLARAIARPGVALHARAPNAEGRTHFELATLLTRVAQGGAGLVIVNDRLDVAGAVRAGGIHLPERGLPIDAVRPLLSPRMLLGCSVHSADDARRAADGGADYVFLGPIWETPTHQDRPALGTKALHGLPIPVIAIGGITPERVRACRDAGAWGVAAVSALWRARDPSAATAEMLVCLGG
jgi:thiamine-phosphate pyrophosphorylase